MRVPWIRVHGDLYEKPVVTRLSESTRISRHEAVSVLVAFWSGVSRHAKNGFVREHSDGQLELWARWHKRPGAFAKWAREQHLDDDGRVREWDEYAGKLEVIRERDRTRKSAGIPAERSRNSSGMATETPRNSVAARANETRRDETRRKSKEKPGTDAGASSPPELPDWVAPAAEVWIAKVGAVTIPRLRFALEPLIQLTSLAAVLAAIDVYASPDEGPKGPRRIEFFAEEFQRWHRIAQTPMVDPETREPTERMKRVMAT